MISNENQKLKDMLRCYKESYREIKNLFEINKQIFKISLKEINEVKFKDAISILNNENALLFNILLNNQNKQLNEIQNSKLLQKNKMFKRVH